MLSDEAVERVYRILTREMPGRTPDAKGPKGQPDAFRSCVSCMLSAQSLDRNTAKASRALFALATVGMDMITMNAYGLGGAALARRMTAPGFRRGFDAAVGVLLLLAAALIGLKV